MRVHCCWIDGQERPGTLRRSLIDPCTGAVYAEAAGADVELVDEAMESARRVFPRWRAFSAHERAGVLRAVGGAIRSRLEELMHSLSREVGKPLAAAREEVLSAASLFEFFAEEATRLSGRMPLLGIEREHVMILREPVGVALAITPFNYPLSTLCTKVAPALAVGCTVVAKPDEHTPGSTLEIARLAVEAGLPPGAFNVILGDGPLTGRVAVNHPVPRMVTFTGSTEVGKQIQRACAERVKRVVLELGGNCPAIVCADAPWRRLMPQLISQCYKNSGQYCYRISRLYVAQQIFEPFLREFILQSRGLKIGPADDPATDLGPLNNAGILERVESQVRRALAGGVRLESGGDGARPRGPGFYYPPTVLVDVHRSSPIRCEEVFGPVALVMPFQDPEEALADANASPYGLAGYIFTRDLALALELVGRLEVGSVWVNRIHQAFAQVPFGGMKESGLGREKSGWGLEEFTELKAVYFSY